MNIKLSYKIGLILIILAGFFFWGRQAGKVITVPKAATVLPPDVAEEISVNPDKHTIAIQTATGTKTEFLPDRVSVIDLHNNGTLTVTSAQSGFEHSLFIGANFSDVPRLMIGVDLFFIKKFDLGIGIMDKLSPAQAPRVFVMGSYTVLDNLRVGVTYDNTQHIGVGITVRI